MSDPAQNTVDEAMKVGTVVQGQRQQYKLIEIIGEGGMGQVWKADTLTKDGTPVSPPQHVAIKFLRRELEDESRASRERFEREIKVLEALRGFRGIVKVDDWGFTSAGSLFMAMEFVKDPTLDKLVEDNMNGVPQMLAVQIVLEILLILEPVHRQKFIHRDLKPKNIAVSLDPLAVRVLDFGLAKPFEEGTGNYKKVTQKSDGGKKLMGSVHYIAPEQFQRQQGQSVDERTDLYAVGIVLYELLTGAPPFRGVHVEEILKQHRDKNPDPVYNDVEGHRISNRLQGVLKKALEKNQNSRYRNAEEFKNDLYEVVHVLNRAQRPKKEISKEYKTVRKIAAGASGQVWEGERVTDGLRVAIKLAHEHTESDWQEEMILNETERTFDHENIVKLIDAGIYENRVALVMELMDKVTVEDLLQQYRDTGFPEATFYEIIIDVCRGLFHAHSKNVMHRDVKPANFLRSFDGRTKVGDFGLAKRFDRGGGSKATAMLGTQAYMAPEQFNLNERIDHRADIYSVGIVMYEMLSGRLPFSEPYQVQHLVSDPSPLEIVGAFSNPEELARLVERCLQKDREKRPQTMKELAQELARIRKLAPQTTPYKPFDFRTQTSYPETGPDGATIKMTPAGGMARPGTAEMQTGIPVQKVAMIVAAVVVVLGSLLYIFRDQILGKRDPGPLTAETDFVGLVDAGSWSEIVAKKDELADDRVRADIASRIKREIGRRVENSRNDFVDGRTATFEQPDVTAPLEALGSVTGAETKGALLASFVEDTNARAASKGDESALWPWEDADFPAYEAKAKELDTYFERNENLTAVARRASRMREAAAISHNGATLLSRVDGNDGSKALTAADASDFARLYGANASEARAKSIEVRAALRKLYSRRAAKAGALGDAFAILRDEILPAMGSKSEAFPSALDRLALKRDAWSQRPNVSDEDAVESAAFALFEAESVVVGRFLDGAFTTSPDSWAKSFSQLAADGLRFDIYGNGVVERFKVALAKHVEEKCNANGTTRRLEDAEVKVIDDAVAALRSLRGADGSQLLTEARLNEIQTKKGEIVAPFQPEGVKLKDFNAAMDAVRGKWKDAPAAAIRRAITAADAMNSPEGDSARNEVIAELRNAGRWLTLRMILNKIYGQAKNGVEDSALALFDSTKLDWADQKFDTKQVAKLKYNIAWRKGTDASILLKLKVPEGPAWDNVAASVGAKECPFDAKSGELTIELTPQAAASPRMGESGPLVFGFDLTLKSNDETFVVPITVDAKRDADFAAPTAVSDFDVANYERDGNATLTVGTASSESLSGVKVKVGDQSFDATLSADGKEATMTVVAATLLASAKGVSIEAIDGFENLGSSELKADAIRTTLAARLNEAIDVSWSPRISTISGQVDVDAAQAGAAVTSLLGDIRRMVGRLKNDGLAGGDIGKDIGTKVGNLHFLAQRIVAQLVTQSKTKETDDLIAGANPVFAELQATLGVPLPALERAKEPVQPVTSGNNGNVDPQPPVNVDPYPARSGNETVGGIVFIPVDPNGDARRRFWMAQTEFTVADAKNLGLWSRLEDVMKKSVGTVPSDRPNLPLAGIRDDRDIKEILASFAKAAGTDLGRSEYWGASMTVDVPTTQEWTAAFAATVRTKYSWGNDAPDRLFNYSGDNPKASDLRDVTEDAGGTFRFLSGNVAEVVRVGASFRARGGSLRDAKSASDFPRFEKDRAPESLNNWCGIRLVIRRR